MTRRIREWNGRVAQIAKKGKFRRTARPDGVKGLQVWQPYKTSALYIEGLPEACNVSSEWANTQEQVHLPKVLESCVFAIYSIRSWLKDSDGQQSRFTSWRSKFRYCLSNCPPGVATSSYAANLEGASSRLFSTYDGGAYWCCALSDGRPLATGGRRSPIKHGYRYVKRASSSARRKRMNSQSVGITYARSHLKLSVGRA